MERGHEAAMERNDSGAPHWQHPTRATVLPYPALALRPVLSMVLLLPILRPAAIAQTILTTSIVLIATTMSALLSSRVDTTTRRTSRRRLAFASAIMGVRGMARSTNQ